MPEEFMDAMSGTTGAAAALTLMLRAGTQKFKEDMDAAGKLVGQFTNSVKRQFMEIGPSIATAFSVYEIVGFVREGVAQFAAMERSLQQLGAKVDATGTSWKAAGAAVNDYLEKIEDTTRFSKESALDALSGLVQKTGDLHSAQSLLNIAMNATAKGYFPDLGTAAQNLGLVFLQNQRGLMQVSRAFGITGSAAKDAQGILDTIAAKTNGAAAAEDNLATSLDKLSHRWDELKRNVGGYFAEALEHVINFYSDHGEEWKNVQGSVKTHADSWKQKMAMIDAYLAKHKHAMQTITHEEVTVKALQLKAETTWRDEFTRSQNQQMTIFGVTIASMADTHLNYIQRAGEHEDEFHARVKRAEEDRKKNAEETWKTIEGFAKTANTNMGEGYAKLFKTMSYGNLHMKKGFKELGNSMVDSFIQALAGQLDASAAWSLAKAIAETVALDPMAATDYAASALYEAGASGLRTLAGNVHIFDRAAVNNEAVSTPLFARGGIATRPTAGIFGEAGPEALIPLTDRRASGMLGGPTVVHLNGDLNFPGVRSAADASGTPFRQSVALELGKQTAELFNRRGYKRPPVGA